MSSPEANSTEYLHRVGNTYVFHNSCVPYKDEMRTKGFLYGENPLNYVMPIFMLQIILLFLLSRTLHFLLRPLKQPQYLCHILGGIILGPSVLGHNNDFMNTMFPQRESVVFNTFASVGTICFIFTTAVKTDIEMIRKASKKAWTIGTVSFFVPYIFHLVLFQKLGHLLPGIRGGPFYLLLSAICSSTYVPVIVQSLDELNMLDTELGQLATSATMVNLLIGLVLASTGVASAQNSTPKSLLAFSSICVMVCFIFFVVRPAVLWIAKKTPEDKPVHESYIVAVILGTFIIGIVSDMLGATTVTGVVLVGIVIPDGPPLGSTLTERVETFTREIFMPFFYARIGIYTNIFAIRDWKAFIALNCIIMLGHLAKTASAFWSSMFFDLRVRNAFVLSLLLNIWGIIEYTGIIHWLIRDVIDTQSYTTFIVFNLAMTAITTPMIQILYKPQRLNSANSVNELVRSLQTAPRDQELRILICIRNDSNVHGMFSLLEASNPNTTSPLCVYLVHLVQFMGREVPLLVPYKRHRRRHLFHKSNHIMTAFENYAKNSRGPVTMLPYSLISSYRTMHDSICNLAQDKRIPLIVLPFRPERQAHPTKSNELRKFTAKIQADASCTVGILVEKNLNFRLDLANFTCNIAVLFFGGADDREALTLAIRMSGNPNISITVIRISLIRDKDQIDGSEKLLDDSLIREFKGKNLGNACAIIHEVAARDNYLEVTNLIRTLDSSYDLVIVGKRRAANFRFEEEIVEWIEFPELGAIGDMLASLDNTKMSVLVMQQCGIENVALHQNSVKSIQLGSGKLEFC